MVADASLKRKALARQKSLAPIEQRAGKEGRIIGHRVARRFVGDYKRGDPGIIHHIGKEIVRAAPLVRDLMLCAHITAQMRSARESRIAMATEAGNVGRESVLAERASALARRAKVNPARLRQLEAKYDAQALTVLKDASDLVEARMQTAMAEIHAQGLTTQDGIKALREALDTAGVGPMRTYRLEAIFRTQTQIGYGAGQWTANQDPDIDEILWGYQYATVGDDRVRPEHAVLDGVTLPKDDPFWQTNFPPNGWNCRCAALELFDERDIAAAPTGTVEVDGKEITPGADEGFRVNFGEILGSAGRLVDPEI